MFLGRKNELEKLNRRYKGTRKEFGVIYGRRRIGKTELVKEFFKDKDGLFFQARRDTAYGNFRSFSYELDKLLGLPVSFIFPNWESAFDSLTEHFENRRFVLVVDEYPYIVSQNGSFSSLMQAFYDHAGDNLFLILPGSDVSFLKNEIQDHASPLCKRRTFEMELTRLGFDEAVSFFDGLDAETKCDFLSLTSSYPFYLFAIDKNKTFKENIRSLFFHQFGPFFDLPDQILSNSTNVQDVYNGILSSFAHRHYRVADIASDLPEDPAKVSKYLATLVHGEIIEKRQTFMGNQKSHYYVIADPMLRFCYIFIYEDQERIKGNGEAVFREKEEAIHDFVCRAFADTSTLYVEKLNREGILSKVYPRLQNFKVDQTKLGRSVELDGLAESGDSLLVMECKYRNIPFTNAMMEHLKESASIFSKKRAREYCIFSKSGFSKDFLRQENVRCFDLNDMFR